MGDAPQALSGPDLAHGIPLGALTENAPLLGHAGGEAVVVVRSGGEVYALGATCSHYGGPLADGAVWDGRIHCPWHHACFDLKTGAAAAPALNAVACYDVARDGDVVRVGARRVERRAAAPATAPTSVVIVGAGAAGAACAETLRREGYDGPVTLIGTEAPVDRPNLSKDYLAGTAQEDWIALRTPDFYAVERIDLIAGDAAEAIDTAARTVRLASGKTVTYGALVYATGAEPVRLPLAGAALPHVFTLRTFADSRAIVARAATAKRAVVLGASFIGLEVAAALRTRGLDVTVVAPETVPLARVVGDAVGAFVRGVHEGKGVRFLLGRKPAAITEREVTLDDGAAVSADVVVMGVGVKPRVALAQAAGLSVDNGVVVDGALSASVDGVYAAGDVANYAGPRGRARIEHWQLAGRQGQFVARALLGRAGAFADVPFFWSAHFDATLCYVGRAATWDVIEVRGSLERRDALVAYRERGAVKAVVTLGRDRASLAAERLFERGDAAGLDALVTER